MLCPLCPCCQGSTEGLVIYLCFPYFCFLCSRVGHCLGVKSSSLWMFHVSCFTLIVLCSVCWVSLPPCLVRLGSAVSPFCSSMWDGAELSVLDRWIRLEVVFVRCSLDDADLKHPERFRGRTLNAATAEKPISPSWARWDDRFLCLNTQRHFRCFQYISP